MPLRIWDEARLAINAEEMTRNGNLLVTHFEGQPDMWNTKPPMMIWLQALFIKTIGLDELSIRLPSALAAFFTCMALVWFSVKYLGGFWFGFVTSLVLITSQGYVNMHGSRSGDYDTLLTLFTMLYSLFFFIYLELGNRKHLYLTFVFITLAGLTKGIAGLFFLPALAIYALVRKKALHLLTNKHTYLGLLIPITLIAGYYLLREAFNPGYIDIVFENELGGRYNAAGDVTDERPFFYFNNIINIRFSFWYLLLPCGLIIGAVYKNKVIKNLTIFSTIIILLFYFIINGSDVKMDWYDMPMYPFMAILAATFIHFVFELLSQWKAPKKIIGINVLPYVFLLLLFIAPYLNTWSRTYMPEEPEYLVPVQEIGYVLKEAVRGHRNFDGYKFLVDQSNPNWSFYYSNWIFYQRVLKEKGQKFTFIHYKDAQPGDYTIMYDYNVREYIDDTYHVDRLEIRQPVHIYHIKTPKE